MTFEAQETSVEHAAPIELFEFRMGNSEWLFTNVEQEITLGNDTYKPTTIKRNELGVKEEVQKAGLRVTMVRDNPVAELFIPDNPSEIMSLTIKKLHRTDSDQEVQVFWKGRVLKSTFDGITTELDCESIFISLERPGLRRKYQTICPHVLYDENCGVIPANFRERVTVDNIDGFKLTAPEFANKADGYFTAGRVETLSGVKEMISGHSGDTITLVSRLQGAEAGDIIDVFPGCDHTLKTCQDVFDNLDNNGAFAYVPDRSPFGGNPVM